MYLCIYEGGTLYFTGLQFLIMKNTCSVHLIINELLMNTIQWNIVLVIKNLLMKFFVCFTAEMLWCSTMSRWLMFTSSLALQETLREFLLIRYKDLDQHWTRVSNYTFNGPVFPLWLRPVIGCLSLCCSTSWPWAALSLGPCSMEIWLRDNLRSTSLM